jgi:alpha,alpha-trehalose phosphorylase
LKRIACWISTVLRFVRSSLTSLTTTSVVISSEMKADESSVFTNANDPRQTRVFAGRVLHHRTSYAKDRRIVLCHATEKSRLTLACATDHTLETTCRHDHQVSYTEDFGQVAYTIDARPGCSIDLTKFMVYHTSGTASAEELCGRAEWTMDRMTTQGFHVLLLSQEQYMEDYWRRGDVRPWPSDTPRSGGLVAP